MHGPESSPSSVESEPTFEQLSERFQTLQAELRSATELAYQEGRTEELARVVAELELLQTQLTPVYEAAQRALSEAALDASESKFIFGKEFEQVLSTGYTAYCDVLEGMGKTSEVVSKDQVRAEVIKEWSRLGREGMVDYMYEEIARLAVGGNAGEEPEPLREMKYNLLVVPNLDLTRQDIFAAAEKFGEGQPKPLRTLRGSDSFYDQYAPQQLSGYNPDRSSSVKLFLMPTKCDVAGARVEAQRVALDRFRWTQTKKRRNADCIQVPSVLAAITNWYYLRAENNLRGDQFAKTYVRQLDLMVPDVTGAMAVPDSYVYGDEQPTLSWSGGDVKFEVRLGVGER